MNAATELWWVSVGGNPCEPARMVIKGDNRTVFTVGCNDGTEIMDGCGIELVEKIERIPPTPAAKRKAEKAWLAKLARDRRNGVPHRYRRFD